MTVRALAFLPALAVLIVAGGGGGYGSPPPPRVYTEQQAVGWRSGVFREAQLPGGNADTSSWWKQQDRFDSDPQPDYAALAALDARDHPGVTVTIESIVVAAAAGRVREVGGRITADEFRALLVVANWPAELHGEALAVACGVGNRSGFQNGESGCGPRSMGDGGRSYGLFQLNGETWAPYCGVTPADLLDPLTNVSCGLEVYEYDIATGGPPWRQWSVKP